MGILENEVVQMYKIMDQDICYCGSGYKFLDCCKKQIHKTRIDKERFDINMNIIEKSGGVLSPKNVFKVFHQLNQKCLLCSNSAIKSHTVSNNRMRKVFNGDFVCCPKPNNKGGYVLQKEPINSASVFYGRCEIHDNGIFSPIDNGLDITNINHKNLLSYRSIAREYRMKNNMLKLFYSMFVLRGNNKRDFRILQSLIGAYQGMIDNYKVMKYIWTGVSTMKHKWNGLKHYTFELGKIEPMFVSSVLSPAENNDNLVIITIYTDVYTNKGYCLLSHFPSHKISQIFCKKLEKKGKNGNIIYELNKIISQNCENVVCDIKQDGEIIDAEGTIDISNLYDGNVHEFIRTVG